MQRRKFLFTILPLALAISPTASGRENLVAFNTKSLKYHKLNCEWAIKCTANCVNISKKDAISRGGVPCRVCGG